MVKPKIIRVLNIGLVVAFLAGATSFFIKLVPCRVSTSNASAIGLCKLPSIFKNLQEPLTNQYYLISNNPLTGLIFQFFAVLIIALILANLFKKRPKKILDLTKEKKQKERPDN